MVDVKKLAALWTTVTDAVYQRLPRVVSGLIGDGTTTERVDVPNSTIHVFFRPRLSTSELWEVRHTVSDVPRWHGWPCFAQFNDAFQEWEIKSTDTDSLPGYFDSFDFRYVAEHAPQHIINEDAVGHDPVWIYRRAMVNLRPRSAPDSSLRLYIQPGALPWEDHPLWDGGYGPDLTRYLPSAGEVWATHYIRDDATVGITVGSAHPESARWSVTMPVSPAGTVAIANVALTASATALIETLIWDARQSWATVSMTENLLNYIATVIEEQEMMWILHLEGEL